MILEAVEVLEDRLSSVLDKSRISRFVQKVVALFHLDHLSCNLSAHPGLGVTAAQATRLFGASDSCPPATGYYSVCRAARHLRTDDEPAGFLPKSIVSRLARARCGAGWRKERA